jgi:hypothetical protein
MSGPEPVSFSLDTVSKAALSLVQTLTVNEANTYERHRTIQAYISAGTWSLTSRGARELQR